MARRLAEANRIAGSALQAKAPDPGLELGQFCDRE
jgi:hypothetical protein